MSRPAVLIIACCVVSLAGCSGSSPPTSAFAAHGGSDLVKEAALAVDTRFSGTVWTNVREKQGLREAVVCAEVAGQQVFYREKRQALFAQSDFAPEMWASLYDSWCVGAPAR